MGKIPIEEQRELDCLALDLPNVQEKFQYYNHQEKQDGSQLFVLPPDIELESNVSLEHDHCLHRFLGEAQIAWDNYRNPQMISAHVIVFDEDTLGVIFLELQSMS